MSVPIYLDHNATTPLDSRVAAAMSEIERSTSANPSSQHAPGRAARKMIEESREEIASLLGASLTGKDAARLIFTSGGAEANNLAILRLGIPLVSSTSPENGHALCISSLEHPSVLEPALHAANARESMMRIPALPSGTIDLAALRDRLIKPPRLVALMLGNNETGVLQPVAAAAEMCRAAGTLLHTDAVQVVGKLPVHFHELGCHSLACAAHKFHGPRGIGALLVASGVPLSPLLFGGHQQEGLRPGTESIALVVGMRLALRICHDEHETRRVHLRKMRDSFEEQLQAALPRIVVHGRDATRLPHTSCIAFPPLNRQALFIALDQMKIACSTGSACASGSSEPSPTLLAMGLARELVESSLRFSFGIGNSLAEVDEAIRRIVIATNRLGK